jgi:HK97 family phage prohead protease
MSILERSVGFEVVRAVDNGDGLTLDGYAAVWDTPTRIDSWEGCFDEQLARGSFKKTIRETTPVLQFDHGRHMLIGSMPIGRIDSLEEDDRGLHVIARLSDNWLIEPVRDAIRDKAVNGMSFRFEVVRDQWFDNAGVKLSPAEVDQLSYDPGDRGPLKRTITELKCRELGPVVFPAYVETSVGVRARAVANEIRDDADMRRELLASLTRDGVGTTVPTDEDLSVKEVALALLFGDAVRDAPPVTEHPSPAVEDDAPLPDEHPSEERETHLKPEHIQRRGQILAARLELALKGSERYAEAQHGS